MLEEIDMLELDSLDVPSTIDEAFRVEGFDTDEEKQKLSGLTVIPDKVLGLLVLITVSRRERLATIYCLLLMTVYLTVIRYQSYGDRTSLLFAYCTILIHQSLVLYFRQLTLR